MQQAQTAATYIIISVMLFALMIIHLFGLYPLQTGTFSVFLVSLFTAVMLLPLLKYLKFFNLIEMRKSVNKKV